MLGEGFPGEIPSCRGPDFYIFRKAGEGLRAETVQANLRDRKALNRRGSRWKGAVESKSRRARLFS